MELILWRHAEAEDGPPDMERALTAKGHKQAEKVAAWLKPRLPAHTHILVSPARRAQQTAAALGKDFSTLDLLGPAASAESVLQAAGWPEDADSVLIVGHQPTLGEVAARVLAGQAASWNLKKGGVWWFSSRGTGKERDIVLRAVMAPDLL